MVSLMLLVSLLLLQPRVCRMHPRWITGPRIVDQIKLLTLSGMCLYQKSANVIRSISLGLRWELVTAIRAAVGVLEPLLEAAVAENMFTLR